MDYERLNLRIDKSGYRRDYVADQIGLSRQGLGLKLKGKTEFTRSEIVALCQLLEIKDPQEVQDIFFN